MQHLQQTLDQLGALFLTGPIEADEASAGAIPSPSRRRPTPRPGPASDAPTRLKLTPADHRLDEYHLENRLAEVMDGPVPLDSRCPQEWPVRMLVDRAGRIHIWRGQVDHDTHAGIVSLINARFWMRDNIALIALTHPECHFDLNAEPMLHLFTTEGARGSNMDGLLGPYLKIHVLQGYRAVGFEERGSRRRPA